MLAVAVATLLLSFGNPTSAAPTASTTNQHLLLLPITSTPLTRSQLIPDCATYHGTANEYSLYRFSLSCPLPLQSAATNAQASPWKLISLPTRLSSSLQLDGTQEEGHLIHSQPSALDLSVPALVERLTQLSFTRSEADHQHPFSSSNPQDDPQILHTFDNQAGHLLYFPTSSSLHSFTSSQDNAFVELVSIPSWPLPLPLSSLSSSSSSKFYPPPIPVPEKEVARIQHHLDNLKFQPLISILLESLDKAKFTSDVRYLTGENQTTAASEDEEWVSRHSMSEGGYKASNWLLAQFSALNLNCTQHEFRPNFAPLVSCEVPGSGLNSNETVVLGAHFDSRGSFGYPTAPGGDDDGSGTSLLLSLAAHIQAHGLVFKRKLVIAAFAGEEQGLLGSQWLAKNFKDKGEDIALMIQVDMIGYRKPGEPVQLAFPPDHLGLQEARYLLGNLSSIYVPELVVGTTPACCSDHQSFMSQGYASTWVFERNGPIADPFYHHSGDLSKREGYDFEQIWLTSKVVLAAVLEVAGFSFP